MQDTDANYRVLQEGNLATEVGLTVLDVVGVYCSHFKVNGEISLDAIQVYLTER